MIVIANAKKPKLLQFLKDYINTLKFRLYQNDYNPTNIMALASFTEVDDTGYVERAPGGFGNATFNATTGHAQCKADEWVTVFNFVPGAFTVFGYYVVDPSDNGVVWAERAIPPFPVAQANDCYAVVPKLSLSLIG